MQDNILNARWCHLGIIDMARMTVVKVILHGNPWLPLWLYGEQLLFFIHRYHLSYKFSGLNPRQAASKFIIWHKYTRYLWLILSPLHLNQTRSRIINKICMLNVSLPHIWLVFQSPHMFPLRLHPNPPISMTIQHRLYIPYICFTHIIRYNYWLETP